jgi:hypothetical protein
MEQHGTLRLVTFRPARPGFDSLLRDEFVPRLLEFPQLTDLHVGRQGPDELGTRLVATTWASSEAMIATLGEGLDAFSKRPELLADTADLKLDVLELMVALRFDRVEAPRPSAIVRVARGRVQPGALGLYREIVLQGTCADVQAGHGPMTLYLGSQPGEDRFVTLSVWDSWAALERATGGDTRNPIRTRNMEQMVEWSVEHFEALPNMERPRAPVSA